MLRVYDCITQEHDVLLVVVAILICLLASSRAISLGIRAARTTRLIRLLWLTGAGVVAGSGIWATHFIAMLAYRPSLPVAYDVPRTVLSMLIAIAMTGLGFGIATYFGRRRPAAVRLGGVVIGLGIFAMHYVGMAALRAPADIHYAPLYVLASLAIGTGFSMLALNDMQRAQGMAGRLKAATWLALGITGLHFTAMAAVSLTTNPLIALPEAAVSAETVAFGVSVTTLVILGVALAGSFLDQRLTALAEREALRLRATVAELEDTKAQLEETTNHLTHALQEAAAANEAKSQFLASMSHELRTPLNAILGFSEALDMGVYGDLSGRQQENLRHIHTAGSHLLELVNDVLDLSKLDANRVELDEAAIDLGTAIGEAVELLARKAEVMGVTVTQRVAPNLPQLRADSRRLRQILLNLLSNALKFTPAGGRITISARRSPSGLRIVVADTGIGIAAADIPKALEHFGQVDSRLARKHDGTGLGLPLCQKLMELHGGTLELESTPGAGTTVTLTFPARRALAPSRAA